MGVKVTRVDVKNINQPEDVRITRKKQMTAERNAVPLILQPRETNQGNSPRAKAKNTQRRHTL